MHRYRQGVSRLLRRLGKTASECRRLAALLWLALMVLVYPSDRALAIPSGGRMGGSFKSSHSAPSSIMGRNAHGMMHHSGMLPPSRLYTRRAATSMAEISELSGNIVESPASPLTQKVKVVDPVSYYTVLTAAYGLMIYRVNHAKEKRDGRKTILGDGASLVKVSVALSVPDRQSPESVLSRLKVISDGAKTYHRKGVQDLTSQVALELLRQMDSVTSASSMHVQCSTPSEANVEFNRMSVFERAKFGKETVNNFNGKNNAIEEVPDNDKNQKDSQSTFAVVTMLVSIEGDRTKIPNINSRRDLENALLRIAADSQVEDCLLAAEILWTPEENNEFLSNQNVVSSYPELVVI